MYIYIDIDIIYNSNIPPIYSKDSMKTWCRYFEPTLWSAFLICFCLWDLMIFFTSGSVVEVDGPLIYVLTMKHRFQKCSGQSSASIWRIYGNTVHFMPLTAVLYGSATLTQAISANLGQPS